MLDIPDHLLLNQVALFYDRKRFATEKNFQLQLLSERFVHRRTTGHRHTVPSYGQEFKYDSNCLQQARGHCHISADARAARGKLQPRARRCRGFAS